MTENNINDVNMSCGTGGLRHDTKNNKVDVKINKETQEPQAGGFAKASPNFSSFNENEDNNLTEEERRKVIAQNTKNLLDNA